MEAIKASELKLFKQAFDNAGIGMALVSLKGDWLDVNPYLTRMLGYDYHELMQSNFQHITYPDDLNVDLELLQETIEGKRSSYQMEKRYLRKDAKILYAILNVSIVRDEKSRPQFFISQIQDITEYKKVQEQLYFNSKQAYLGEMAAGVAHEINNPLTVIRATAELINEASKNNTLSSEQLQKHSASIIETTDRIANVIKNMRDISITNQKDRKEVYQLSKTIEHVLSVYGSRIRNRNIELKIDVNEDIKVLCYPTKLAQVIINLLDNAFHAVLESNTKNIDILATNNKEFCTLSIIDSGLGISKQDIDKIMLPFFTKQKLKENLGLGLSISSNIMQAMGGQLYYQQLEQKNKTCFCVDIPLYLG